MFFDPFARTSKKVNNGIGFILLSVAVMALLATGLEVRDEKGGKPRERRSKSWRSSKLSGRDMMDIEECAPDRAKGGVTCFTCESISPLQQCAGVTM